MSVYGTSKKAKITVEEAAVSGFEQSGFVCFSLLVECHSGIKTSIKPVSHLGVSSAVWSKCRYSSSRMCF